MIGTVVQPRRPGDDLEAVDAGQAEVEDHEVGVVVGGEAQRVLAGGGEVDLEVAGPEVGGQGPQDLGLVVDDAGRGSRLPPPRPARPMTIVMPPPGVSSTVQLAAHGLDEALGHGQPEPHPVRAAVAEPLERLEDPLPVGHRDARAPVDDPEVDAVRRPRRPRCAPGRSGPDACEGVGGEVGHGPLEQGRVGRGPAGSVSSSVDVHRRRWDR